MDLDSNPGSTTYYVVLNKLLNLSELYIPHQNTGIIPTSQSSCEVCTAIILSTFIDDLLGTGHYLELKPTVSVFTISVG